MRLMHIYFAACAVSWILQIDEILIGCYSIGHFGSLIINYSLRPTKPAVSPPLDCPRKNVVEREVVGPSVYVEVNQKKEVRFYLLR